MNAAIVELQRFFAKTVSVKGALLMFSTDNPSMSSIAEIVSICHPDNDHCFSEQTTIYQKGIEHKVLLCGLDVIKSVLGQNRVCDVMM